MSDIFREISRLRDAGELGVLVVVVESVGSSPAKAGARMIVRPDGSILGTVGGGALEHHAIGLAADVLAAGASRLVPLHLADDLGMSCGGRATIYLEPLGSESRLYVFGAGHIAVQLCEMASRCGFAVVVCDDRAELCSRERFPRAVQLFGSAQADGLDALGIRDHLARAYVVVVTHSHELDFGLVRAIAPLRPVYLGMIGSKRKRRALETHLVEAGLPGELRDFVRCPAGMPLGGDSPAEIALSITAELVAVRAARRAPPAGPEPGPGPGARPRQAPAPGDDG
jgi:xanthine dehydrogenase accessory factor